MVDLTHELRTPLAIVTGSLHRISRLIDVQSPVSARLDMAQEEVKRIHRLLDNLTVMTRLQVESEGLGLVQHPCSVCLKNGNAALIDHRQAAFSLILRIRM